MDDLDEQVASEHIVERQCESPPFPRYEVMLAGIVAVIAGLAAFCNVRVKVRVALQLGRKDISVISTLWPTRKTHAARQSTAYSIT